MAMIAAILFVALAKTAESGRTYITAYTSNDCTGGAVDPTVTYPANADATNKQRELRWSDSDISVFTDCNELTCWIGGNASCTGTWTMKFTCPTAPATDVKIATYLNSGDCSTSSHGFYTLTSSAYATLASGSCATATFTASGNRLDDREPEPDASVSMIVTGATGPAATLCGAAAGSTSGSSGETSGGTSGTTNAPNATNAATTGSTATASGAVLQRGLSASMLLSAGAVTFRM